jgi:hypothetical protein
MNANGHHRTSDLTLVAYLATKHFNFECMELDGNEVTFLFPFSRALSAELDLYRQEKALVEPIALGRQMVRTRRELFRFKTEQQRSRA